MMNLKLQTYTHSQSGLTALKVAQSEGQQDVCDILLQYTQRGSKVTNQELAGELRQEEETKAELAEVGMRTVVQEWNVNLSASLSFRSKERVIPRERVQRSSLNCKGQMMIAKDLRQR